MITRLLKPIQNLFPQKHYSIQPVNSSSTDLRIVHRTGVVIQIETDGSVIVSSANNLTLHAKGNLAIASDTHIGLVAPRIDLN